MAFQSGHFKIEGIKFIINKPGEQRVEFNQAKAGHKKINKFLLSISGIIIASLLSIIPVTSGSLLGALVVALFAKNELPLILIITSIIIGYAANISIPIFDGIKIERWLVVMGLLTIGSGLITLPFQQELDLVAVVLYFSLSIGLAWLGLILAALCATFNSICCGILGPISGLVGAGLLATFITISSKINDNSVQESQAIITLMAAITVLITGAIVAQKAMKGDPKFAWIRDQAVFWAATGGTSFYGCDLTDACFDGADLPHTDFRQSKLTRASFEGATRLDLSRLQGTILEQPKVRKLLTSKMGVDEDYTGANFNGANLRGAILTGAILAEVQALDADFSGATLTGACIQEWNINKHTRFENVLCEKVYLKCTRKGNGTSILSEPKPDYGTFQPGEFEKWITEIQDTVDLIFQKGLNWKAFAFAMTQTAIDNEGLDVSRYRVEQKGEGVTSVKVGVSPEAKKAEIHQGIVNNYDSAVEMLDRGDPLLLQAKDDKIEEVRKMLESQWQEFREFVNVFSEANRSISIHGEGNRVYILKQAGDIMETKSEGFNVGGNFAIGGDNMTLTGAQLTLGDLTGQVTNTIQELHDVKSENGQDLVNILTNLQQSITTDPALAENQQKRALKAVETLAKEGKKPPEERDKDIAGMALDALQGISATVGHASKLAEFAEKYLPTLSKLFGLVG